MNKMKKLAMATCVFALVTILNIFPINHNVKPMTAEAATASVYTTSEGQIREEGWTTIVVKTSSKIKSVTASESNSKILAKKAHIKNNGYKATITLKGLKAGSASVCVKIKLSNGQTIKKRLSVYVYNMDRYNYLYKLIRNEGFTKNEALGIMANLLWETGPVNMYNRGSFGLGTLSRSFVNPTDHTGSYYGMFQLEGSRKYHMISWCRSHGYSYSSVKGQIKFMAYEMKTSETRARYMLKSADNAREAAVMFASYYERCATRYRSPRGTTAQRLDKFF